MTASLLVAYLVSLSRVVMTARVSTKHATHELYVAITERRETPDLSDAQAASIARRYSLLLPWYRRRELSSL